MIQIRTTLDSDTLHIPELKPLIGKTVEITIQEAAQEKTKSGWEEIDRIAETNAQRYPGSDVGVDIVREMRNARHVQEGP